MLIYLTPDQFAARTDPERSAALWGAFFPYLQSLKDAGVFVAGAGLEPPGSARAVDLHAVAIRVQDGPYAETKEQLGGFITIDVPDLETALDWARRFPKTSGKIVEVRPNLPPPNREA